MKRKLIRQGDREHGSYTITLPSKWIKKFGLNAGDEIEINDAGNELTLSAGNDIASPKSTSINARGFSITQLRRHVSEAYRSGAETIKIIYDDIAIYHPRSKRRVRVKDEIESLVPLELLGMEIEKATPDTIIITQFSEAREAEFDSALRKIFFKLQEQYEQAAEALKSMDPEQLKAVWLSDRAVNKFCNFCMRILNKGHSGITRTNELYAGLVQLEIIGDIGYWIPLQAEKFGLKKVRPEIISLFNDVREAVGLYSKYFYDLNEDHFAKILKLREKFFEVDEKMLKADPVSANFVTKLGFCYEILVNLQDVAIGIIKAK